MGKDSGIEWTHHTFNPWWGCARVSPGCENCYAEAFAKRTGVQWGVNTPRKTWSDKHWDEPLKWNAAAERAGERHRVFCASMADVFEDRRDLDKERLRLWTLIAATPHLDWLLLTKRPENFASMLPWMRGGAGEPWRNVWLMTTVEDEKRIDRIDELLQIPAVVHGLSMEPLLGPVEIPGEYLTGEYAPEDFGGALAENIGPRLDWVIVGGESGHSARPFKLEWARSIVAQCRAAGVAVHVKQLGARPRSDASHGEMVSLTSLRSKKGGDWNEWPEDLRIREYPMVKYVR